LPHCFLIAFNGPAFRTLTAKTQISEDAPDVAGVITHAGKALNQIGRAWQSPKLCLVTLGGRPLKQGVDDLLLLLGGESALGAGAAFAGQSGLASVHPDLMPPVSHLPGYLATPGHFGHRQTAPKHFGRLPSPPFHLLVISLVRHARKVA
jgi:hypothetical protein